MSPQRPARPCAHPGCPALVREGSRCPAHQLPEAPRPNANQRGYGWDWSKRSQAYLAAHPTCERCGGRSTDAHHVHGIGADPEGVVLMALCHSCHSALTRRHTNAKRV